MFRFTRYFSFFFFCLLGCQDGANQGWIAEEKPQETTLTVTRSGPGSGAIRLESGSSDCDTSCTTTQPLNKNVTLIAVPSTNSVFVRWSDAVCPGVGTCTATMDQAKTITAEFALKTFPLTITKTGSGTVRSDLSGIDCGGSCSFSYTLNTRVTLTTEPAVGFKFVRWLDAVCPGVGTCTVTMNQAKTITAEFELQTFTLTITKTGSGTVKSDLSGIDCGVSCSFSYTWNKEITLAATPMAGFVFVGWLDGGCPGLGTCRVTMDQDKTITAVFKKIFKLTVTTIGSGIISSDPIEINCGTDCEETYIEGSIVMLTATPASGGVFERWENECESLATSTCVITMNDDKMITAVFSVAFAPAVHFSIAGNARPSSVVTGDMNGDSIMDVIVSDLANNAVWVLMGNGTSTLLEAPTAYPTLATTIWAVVIGDFNNDENPDVATVNEHSDNVSVLLGNEDGSLGTGSNFTVGESPRAIAVADLNDDKNLDIVTTNFSHQAAIVLGDGMGGFSAPETFAVGQDPLSVTTSDLNKDSRPDIIVANASDHTITILLANKTNSFDSTDCSIDSTDCSIEGQVSGRHNPLSVIAVDLNGDSNVDIITANRDNNTVSVLLGQGLCKTVCEFQAPKNFLVGTTPYWVRSGDINDDGFIDLVTANSDSDNVTILLGDGEGGFNPALSLAVGTSPRSVEIVDINGDSKEDLITANRGSRNISVLLGK
ncbi:MAG: VCBS repeat-containing protein [Nitrospirota bacterium]